MLADASGYGLSACVSLLPLIAPFYRMTSKGLSLQTMVRELNAKVRQALPENRAVAAQLVAVDPREGIVSVWNGGMPTAFMLDGFGHHFMEFPLTHPPFGAMADADFDDRIEQHAFARGEQLVLVSDGLLEAMGPLGRRFGEDGLAAALVGLPRSQRRDELMAAINAHLAGVAPADDMTLLLIDCEKEAAPAHPQPAKAVSPRRLGHWHFELLIGVNEFAHIDVVPLLLDVVGRFESMQGKTGELFVILSELFNNALDHGILRLDSRLKHAYDGLETWLLLREERLAALTHGEIRIAVAQVNEGGRMWLRVHCRDSGPGFDVASAQARLAQQSQAHVDERMHGRGLALIQHMAERLSFNESGNEATVLLPIGNT
jgi:anti-sigma regulatory factor (Ser/Thr protein kinase)